MSKLSELIRALIDGTEVEIVPTTKAQTYLVACINGTGSEGCPEPTTVLGGLLCELADKLAGGSPTPTGKPLKILEIDDDGFISKASISMPTVPEYYFDGDYGCARLKALEIAEGVKVLGLNAFANQKELTEIVFPSTLTTINNYAIRWTKATKLYFKACPSILGSSPFANTSPVKDVYVTWGQGEHADFEAKFPSSPTFHYNWAPEV